MCYSICGIIAHMFLCVIAVSILVVITAPWLCVVANHGAGHPTRDASTAMACMVMAAAAVAVAATTTNGGGNGGGNGDSDEE